MSMKTDYVFTRDYLDNNRINLQHYLWVELYGYLLHPEIPTQDPKLKIADVGTGTGIWLSDLASRLPKSVDLHGMDVSFAATPPREWLPKNMKLVHWDVNAAVPSELVGIYDVVHIRNFAFVLQDGDVELVLANLFKLLKPGGHLQWSEPDISSFRIEKMHPENSTDALSQLLKLSQGQDTRLRPTWISNLPGLFKGVGFGDVRADVRDAPPHLALAIHECNLVVHELLARKAGNEGLLEGLKDLLPRVERETREGACWAFTRWTVVGKKLVDN